jgi:hypothetical protein
MAALRKGIPEEDALDDLAHKVFATFARCEYALKAAGFHKGDGIAEPNWQAFARSLSTIFDNPPAADLKEAVEYICHHPPKRQMIKDGNLVWDEAAPTTNLQSDLVLTYVKRVRNNLFHGGKFNGRWFQPERNKLLLTHCLTILHACLNASDEVKEAYHN